MSECNCDKETSEEQKQRPKEYQENYREAKKLQEEYYKDINNKDIKRITLSD